eukprot:2023259-Pyramimonas_sp.AAC.1
MRLRAHRALAAICHAVPRRGSASSSQARARPRSQARISDMLSPKESSTALWRALLLQWSARPMSAARASRLWILSGRFQLPARMHLQ